MQLGVGACVVVSVLGRHLRPKVLRLNLLHHWLRLLHHWLKLLHHRLRLLQNRLIVKDRLRLDHHLAWLQVVVGSLKALSLLLWVNFTCLSRCGCHNWSYVTPFLLVQLSDVRLLRSESNPELSNCRSMFMCIDKLVIRDFLCWIIWPYPVKTPTGATFDEHSVEKTVNEGEEFALIA
jgi:hypothetical protein